MGQCPELVQGDKWQCVYEEGHAQLHFAPEFGWWGTEAKRSLRKRLTEVLKNLLR